MATETTHTEATPTAADQGTLTSRSFLGLLTTQFLGAVNDNMFRWLVVPIGKTMVSAEHTAVALSAGLACFVLPYILLAAPAGYLADRFSKRAVIVGCKVAELAIMLLGVGAILSDNLYLMFAVVALMGSQSALFGPSKFGSIPEIVRADRISAANGLIGMTTVVAIVVGTIGGSLLYTVTTLTDRGGELLMPAGRHLWWVSAVALVGVALAGLAASLMIVPLRPADPKRPFPFNAPRQTVRDLAALGSSRPLLRAALGCAVFWALAAMAQMNVDQFVDFQLGLGQLHVGVLLGVLALGVGVGSVLAGVWSAGRVELGIVSLGSGGIAASAILLSVVNPDLGTPFSPAYVWTGIWLFMLGTSAGLYDVPIQAFLQYRSPKDLRGSILAANNFLTFSAMLVASGLFWLLSSPLGLSPGLTFLVLGLSTVPVFCYVVWLLPGATVRCIVWLLSHTIYRVRVQGREQHLPKEGGALLVANHVSWIDGVLLILHSPRPIRMVAFADYMEKWWWLGVLARDMGTIPIRPGRRSVVESIRTAREAVRAGELVCIFPEGHITRTGKMGEFQPGFLSILKNTGAPLIPIHLGGLWGSVFSWERGKLFWKWPRRWPYPVSIRIGRPMRQPRDTEQVRQAVVDLGQAEDWGEDECQPICPAG
ncbi:MAG: MFS transporter [Pirellulales bacterium]|nr:MFS transporter [Pirellulales bacterium]